MRRVVPVILTRPGVHVKYSAGPDHHVARVADAIRKNRRAKTWRQLEAAVIGRARRGQGSRESPGAAVSRQQGTGNVRRDEHDQREQQLVAQASELHGNLLKTGDEK